MKRLIPFLAFLFFSSIVNAQIDSLLLDAIKQNQVAKVDSLIKTGVSLEALDEHGANALMWACYSADVTMVELLFDNGAVAPPDGGGILYNSSTGWKQSVTGWYGHLLGIAAGEGKVELVKYLIKSQKLSIDSQVAHEESDSLSSWTPLMYAVHKQQPNTIKELINLGANLDRTNKIGQSIKNIETNKLIERSLEEEELALLDTLAAYKFNESSFFSEFRKGNLVTSLPFAKENRRLSEKFYGTTDDLHVFWLNVLGITYARLENFEAAIESSEHSLRVILEKDGKDEKYHTVLFNLGLMKHDLGKFNEFLPILTEVLDYTEKTQGKDSKQYVKRSKQLCLLYQNLGYMDKASKVCKSCLTAFEKAYGVASFEYGAMAETYMNFSINAVAMSGLASANANLNEFETAEALYLEAIEIMENGVGKELTFYANALGKYADLLVKMGKYEVALSYLDRVLFSLKNTFGVKHQNYIANSFEKAKVTRFLGDYSATDSLLLGTIAQVKNLMLEQFRYLPTNAQLAWKASYRNNYDVINSYLPSRAGLDLNGLTEYNIMLKGLVARNISNRTVTSNDDYADWLKLKKQIGQELSKPILNRNDALGEWESEAEALEVKLIEENDSFEEASTNISKLRNQLKEGEVIIDVSHFRYHSSEGLTDSVLYSAHLITPNSDKIQVVHLFEENELSGILKQKNSRSELAKGLYASRGIVPKGKKDLGNLSFIWKPLLPLLKEYNTIHISASGLLNKVNLGAIAISKDSLLSDRFQLLQYNSLLSMNQAYVASSEQDYLLIGGVDYDANLNLSLKDKVVTNEITAIDSNLIATRSKVQSKWQYLPSTIKEVKVIDKLLAAKQFKSKVLTKAKATEEAVKASLSQTHSPKVVHFSTHGFFYEDVARDDSQTVFQSSSNPLIRSGLILAGANYAWTNGAAPTGREDDGILTAYEVANLNLRNTELVVLSACETGLGDLQGTEGVIGLQRAFKLAGAKYIIMSLWQVPDEATQRLMTAFYSNWKEKGMNIPTAFDAAQRSMRMDYDNPYFWAGFVLIE